MVASTHFGHRRINIEPAQDYDYAAMPAVTLPSVTDMTQRLRVASAQRQFASSWQYFSGQLLWQKRLTGAGTLTEPGQKDPCYLNLKTTTASGDKVEFQTKRFQKYQPYREHILTQAVNTREAVANQQFLWGQFTNFNGWGWKRDVNGFHVFYRNNSFENTGTIDTVISRANWNTDKLDGTGPSKLNLTDTQLSYVNVWMIEFVWHGGTGIRWALYYYDAIIPVHELKWSATANKPFARTAFLPIRYELENTGATSAGLDVWIGPVCYSIEGGEDEVYRTWSANRGTSTIAVTSTTDYTETFAVRPKALLGGSNNRGILEPLDFDISASDAILYEVWVGCTVGTGTWTSVNDYSAAEYSLNPGSVTGGRIVTSGYLQGGGGSKEQMLSGKFEDDVYVTVDALSSNLQESIVIRCKKLGGNANVSTAILWREIF